MDGLADAAAAAVDLILARRAWAVVARDNDRDDNGEGGDPSVPNDAATSGGGDNDNASSWMRSGGGMTDGGGGGVGRAHVGHRRHRRGRRRVGHVVGGLWQKGEARI